MTLQNRITPIKVKWQPNCILPNSFFEGRFVPGFHPDSRDYTQWWDEQERRCREGWSDGGYAVTGPYYYHLNFKKINIIDQKTLRPLFDHPFYSEEDQQLFNDFKTARDNRKGIILVTGRGFGKSFDVASIAEHEFSFYEASEVIVSASIAKFANLLWEKINLGLNSQPGEFKLKLLENNKDLIRSGYEYTDEFGTEREGGYLSILRKVIYDHDAEKTRGTRPNIHIFEEIGAWTGAADLLEVYRKTEPSWWRGSYFTCMPILIGTGGAMEAGASVAAKTMFEDPKRYNLMSFEYEGKQIGKFYPAYAKYLGYYEDTGVSDKVGAKQDLDKRREEKKDSPADFLQHTSEFPYIPREAFQVSAGGFLPFSIMENRYVELERNEELRNIVQIGDLDWVREGSRIVDVKWSPNPKGLFQIAEHPVWTRKDFGDIQKVQNLYLGGVDSFDAIEEEGRMRKDKSPLSHIIFKRFWKASDTSFLPVAKLTQVADDAEEAYMNSLKLALYYHAKSLVEYTKIGVIRHYISEGFSWLLYKRPKLDGIVQNSTATQTYGVHMPIEVKMHGIKLLSTYYKKYIDQQYFQSLLRDGMNFSFDGYDKNKHDETMAMAIAMIAHEDMYNTKVKEERAKGNSWPVHTRDSNGNISFGVPKTPLPPNIR